MRLLRRLAVLPMLAIAGNALAQDEQADWEFRADPRTRTTLAGLATTTGINVVVRCVDGGLEAILTGLPPIDAEERQIGVGFGEEPINDQRWNVAIDNTVAVSELPASLARKLREGGQMQLRFVAAGEDGRTIRYVIDLPPSPTAIDATLTACGRPLVDPRDLELEAVGDNGLPADLEWLRRPRPSHPRPMRYTKGFAVVTCMAERDGGLRDCIVETEHPRDAGYGEATVRATRSARLTNTINPDAPIDPERIVFRANYFIAGYQPRAPRTGTRIPRP